MVWQATFNTLGAALFKREIRFKTTEKSHMAANVTDSANKAKSRKGKTPLRTAWTYVQVNTVVLPRTAARL